MTDTLTIALAVIYCAGGLLMLVAGVRFFVRSKRRFGITPDPLRLSCAVLMWPAFILLLGPREVWEAATRKDFIQRGFTRDRRQPNE